MLRQYYLLAIGIVALTPLLGKEIRENPVEKKLERYLPYNIDEIEASAASTNFNPRLVAEELGQKLNQFYLSDPSEKKIANRQDNDSNAAWYRKEWNVNLQRLFMRDLLAKTQKSFIIKEAPNIALLHYHYAQAQMKLKKPYHAAFHFAQSLRYRSLRLDEDIYTNNDRIALVKAGAAEIKDADNYREAKKLFEEKTKEKQRIEEELIVLDEPFSGLDPVNQEHLEALVRAERDRGATILWIDGGKTRNARRYLDVPAVLQPRLRKLTAGRAGDELLLGHSRDGVRRDRRSLWVAVGRICRTAGVPRVCPHSLRGLWATLGVQSGAVSHAVAASLGHGSFEMTAKHYAQPEVVSGACTARMIEMLELQPGADGLLQLPAEELLVRLPQETLLKLVDLALRSGRLSAGKEPGADALALQDALERFEGTVLAVTHDRWFARSFDRFLVFGQDGRVYESDEPVWDEGRVARVR